VMLLDFILVIAGATLSRWLDSALIYPQRTRLRGA
jgi:hypothetical protein